MYNTEKTDKHTGATKPSRGKKKSMMKAKTPFKGMKKKGKNTMSKKSSY